MATPNNAGTEISYEITGEGTPVVLLHGFPDSGRLWRHQVPALTGAGYRVIVPDMRGYGHSARPVEVDAYDIEHLVSDVRAVLADAGVPRAHVVGHDCGRRRRGYWLQWRPTPSTAWWLCRSGIRPRSGAARVSWIAIRWRRLGSLVGQLPESDPEARALIAAGFDQWAAAIGDGLRSLQSDGKLPSDIDPDDLAITLLATLQGGLLLSQVQRSTRPFETAIETLLALAIGR
jgi:pimeloyl-ACP methyl ester carboxylesterase